VSDISDQGGRPDPPAAAEWFAANSGVKNLPLSGWRVVARNTQGVTLAAGRSTMHAVEGRDKTWQVDGGTNCG
jgi:hypothetical protein